MENKRPRIHLGDWLSIKTRGNQLVLCEAKDNENVDSETVLTDRFGHLDTAEVIEIRTDDGDVWKA